LLSTYSTEKPNRYPARIPAILVLLTLILAAVAAIPTGLIGGLEAISMMGVGAGAGLAIVVGGYYCAQLAFRGPDPYAVKIVVGGFLVRLVLLGLTLTAFVAVTDTPPARFVLWLIAFYFLLVLAEAWILAREGASTRKGETTR
jgi:hypothetical protein